MTTDDESIRDANEIKCDVTAASEPARERSVYLSLGTNIGDREANLQQASERIRRLGLEIIRASSIYETEPVGYDDQPWFLNQVIEASMVAGLTFDITDDQTEFISASVASSQKPALDWQILYLLKALQNIEREMGRVRTIPNGPRVIDIDILLCGGYAGSLFKGGSVNTNLLLTSILTIPHPRLHLRRFVLVPLCEIAPDLTHPRLKKSCSELLAELDDRSIVRVYRSRNGAL